MFAHLFFCSLFSCLQDPVAEANAVGVGIGVAGNVAIGAAPVAVVGAAVKEAAQWAPKWSKSQKRPYWTNTEDGSSVWEEPSSVVKLGLLSGWYECKSGDGRSYYHHPATMEDRWDMPVRQGEVAGALDTLPKGWTAHGGEDGGKPYYHHSMQKTTSWIHPKDLPGTFAESATAATASVALTLALGPPALPVSAPSTAAARESAVAAAATAVESNSATTGVRDEALPEGWTAHGLDEGSKPYFHHLASQTTSWIHPKHVDGLPVPWAAVAVEDGTGKVYFHNTATGATSWTKPDR